jgi:hypothetical protein
MEYSPILIQAHHTIPHLTAVGQIWKTSEFPLEQNNPDIFVINSEENSIGITAIQELIEWSHKRPYHYNVKIAVIPRAEQLTVQAQNSLLKTLEEPAPHTLITLITSNPQALLPTVRSRMQMHMYLGTSGVVSTATAQKFLQANYLQRMKLLEELGDKPDRIETTQLISQLMGEIPKVYQDAAQICAAYDTCKQALLGVNGGVQIKLVTELLLTL